MKAMVVFETAIRGLLKNKKRSILTMIGIVVGVASIIIIISLGNAFQSKISEVIVGKNSNVGKNVVNIYFFEDNDIENKVSKPFDESDINLIKDIYTVESVNFLEENYENSIENIEVTVQNITKNFAFDIVKKYEKKIIKGKGLTEIDNDLYNSVILISKENAIKLFGDINSAYNQDVLISGNYYKIIGIYSDDDGTAFKIANNVYKGKVNTSSSTDIIEVIFSDNVKSLEAEKKKVLDRLNNYGSLSSVGEYLESDTEGAVKIMRDVTNALTYFLAMIAGISLFTAGIGIMNMMYVSVTERTLEIAIRRATGATKHIIQIQFLLEGVLVSVVGGLFGYIFGFTVSYIITAIINIPLHIDFNIVLGTILFSVALGVIFSIIPARSAVKKDLIKILK